MLHESNSRRQDHATWRVTSLTAIASTVQKIGTPNFASGVLSSLRSIIDVDACEIFFEDRGEFCLAGQSGERSTLTADAKLSPLKLKSLLRDAVSGAAVLSISGDNVPQEYDRRPHQRITIAGRTGGVLSALHVLRSKDRRELRPAEIDDLREMSPVFHSLVSRHIELAHKRQQSVAPLEALDQIEACIVSTGDLTRRESQVCARILYGMSTYGISLDLGIGKESVVTYRKRAYRRLVISSQRELLVWYLDTYDRQLMRPVA